MIYIIWIEATIIFYLKLLKMYFKKNNFIYNRKPLISFSII